MSFITKYSTMLKSYRSNSFKIYKFAVLYEEWNKSTEEYYLKDRDSSVEESAEEEREQETTNFLNENYERPINSIEFSTLKRQPCE